MDTGEKIRQYGAGFRAGQTELLEKLDFWRKEITSIGCEDNEEVEIMNYELKDWIDEFKGSLN